MTSHTTVKDILFEIAESTKYWKAKSGDSQPLDIRKGKRHIEYNPDVYWMSPQGKIFIFEVAYTEDQRAIVGELTLSSLVPNIWRFCVIVNNEEWAEKIRDYLTIPDEEIRNDEGKFRLPHKVKIICLPQMLKDKEKIKKFLIKKLKSWM